MVTTSIRDARLTPGFVIMSVSISFAAAAVVFFVFLVLTYAALPADRALYVDRVEEAFASQVLPTSGRDWSTHVQTDCIGLSSVVPPYETILKETIAVKTIGFCAELYNYLKGEVNPAPRYYNRHLHGWRVVWLHGLKILSVRDVFRLVFSTGIILLFVIAALSARRVLLSNNAYESPQAHYTRKNAWAVLALGLSFALFFGWDQFGSRITHGLWGIALFGFIGLSQLVNFRELSPLRFAALFAGFGALVAHLDFFNGAAPLGLATVIGVIALQSDYSEDNVCFWRPIFVGAAGFFLGFVSCFALKLVSIAPIFGFSVVTDFFGRLEYRVGGSYQDTIDIYKALEYGIDPRGKATYSLSTISFLAAKLAYSSTSIAFGSRAFGIAILALGTLALILGAVTQFVMHKEPRQTRVVVALLLSVFVIPLWYVLFLQHTVIHTRYMVRILVWIIAVGGMLASFSILDFQHRMRMRSRQNPPTIK